MNEYCCIYRVITLLQFYDISILIYKPKKIGGLLDNPVSPFTRNEILPVSSSTQIPCNNCLASLLSSEDSVGLPCLHPDMAAANRNMYISFFIYQYNDTQTRFR